MADSFNKKQNQEKKAKRRQEKAAKREERKANAKPGSLENMMAYVDEYGNITSTPPDPSKKIAVNLEEIEVSIPKKEEDPNDNIHTGTVTFFNEQKGYGFIRDLDTQDSIFVHANALTEQIKDGQKVTFEVEKGQKGLNAVNVKVVRS